MNFSWCFRKPDNNYEISYLCRSFPFLQLPYTPMIYDLSDSENKNLLLKMSYVFANLACSVSFCTLHVLLSNTKLLGMREKIHSSWFTQHFGYSFRPDKKFVSPKSTNTIHDHTTFYLRKYLCWEARLDISGNFYRIFLR